MTDPGDPLRLLGLKEVAAILGTHSSNVVALIEDGLMPCLRVGENGQPVLNIVMLRAWLEQLGRDVRQVTARPYAPKRTIAPKGTRRDRYVSAGVRFAVLRRCGFRCTYCGRSATDATLVIDHVIPIADGGTNAETNLTAACGECNAGKATKPATEPEVVLWSKN